jgi:predicted metal-dependent hydrolase
VDARFRQAIELFNQREFFACHDVLEELWNETLGPEREFYQGLIHAAVALFHFGEGNLGGARKMYGSAVRYLTPYRPRCGGVNLDAFLSHLQKCFGELLQPHDSYPAGLALVDSLIPTIELTGDNTTA